MRKLMNATTATLVATSMALHAQTPQSVPTPQPPDHPRPTITQTNARAQVSTPVMTISGCLTEGRLGKDATARPKLDRTGLTEDYILTDVKMSPSSSVSGIGVSTKYAIQGLPEAELKKHLNHHVELLGQLLAPDPGHPVGSTPHFMATTVKMLSATCNAAQ